MKWRNSKEHYGLLSMWLHWGVLALLIAVYACMELREFFPKGSVEREALKTLHYMLGLSVLILVWPRLLLTLSGPTPGIVPAPPNWQRVAARWMKVALYALMICMPLAGWLILSAAGKPIPLFGLQLPALIDQGKDAANVLKEIHEAGATLGYFLIGLHAAAALFHHYVMRDNTLTRMWIKR
ncbi:MAG: cytochrome b [Duganella sp.]